MADLNHDELDRVLDAALHKYAAAEPRAGLEERVLANLRAERTRVPDWAWWQWTVASVVVAMVVIGVALLWGKSHRQVIANNPSITVPGVEPPRTGGGLERGGEPVHAPEARPTTKHAVHHKSATTVAGNEPKLDQFPSPQAMTGQEMALARYVSEFPQEATLVARAQEDYEREIQQSMKDATSEAILSDSEQQER